LFPKSYYLLLFMFCLYPAPKVFTSCWTGKIFSFYEAHNTIYILFILSL
jgi:hypothetical protein